eukprot:SAG25_NODE_2295_length_1743_cov_2.142336_2_plen_120_part_00
MFSANITNRDPAKILLKNTLDRGFPHVYIPQKVNFWLAEAELEPELERAMDPAVVLALMVKAMAAPTSSSPVMDEPTEPTEPLERPRRRARARLFVLLEGGVQPDDAKVFDRGKRHTHT